MTTSRMRSLATLTAAAAVVMLASAPAGADDTELFVGAAVAAAPSRPNILFVMDTSGSMDTNVTTQVSFNPADTYSGSCRTDRVYWSNNSTVPNCSTDRYVNASVFTCNAAQPNLASAGIAYVTKAARWRSSRNRWESLSPATAPAGSSARRTPAFTARPLRPRRNTPRTARPMARGPAILPTRSTGPAAARSRSIPATISTGRRAPPSRAPAWRSCRRC